jgi:hypothetical protein
MPEELNRRERKEWIARSVQVLQAVQILPAMRQSLFLEPERLNVPWACAARLAGAKASVIEAIGKSPTVLAA